MRHHHQAASRRPSGVRSRGRPRRASSGTTATLRRRSPRSCTARPRHTTDRPVADRAGPDRASTSGSTAHGSTALGSDLAAQHADGSQQPRRQRVDQAGEHARRPVPGRGAGRRTSCPRRRPPAGGRTRAAAPPSPARRASVAGEEERALGEQVAVGLVLQLSERGVRVPQVQGCGARNAPGSLGQVELGVPRGPPGLLQETTRPGRGARRACRERTPTRSRWLSPLHARPVRCP